MSFFICGLCFSLQVVKLAFDVHTSETAGDILVFLTGTGGSHRKMVLDA